MGDADPHDAILWRQSQGFDAAAGEKIAVADGDPLLVQGFGDILRASSGHGKRDGRRPARGVFGHAPLSDDPDAGLVAQVAEDAIAEPPLMRLDHPVDPGDPAMKLVLRSAKMMSVQQVKIVADA